MKKLHSSFDCSVMIWNGICYSIGSLEFVVFGIFIHAGLVYSPGQRRSQIIHTNPFRAIYSLEIVVGG
jgi:glycopeptide antibiotics resistance protein